VNRNLERSLRTGMQAAAWGRWAASQAGALSWKCWCDERRDGLHDELPAIGSGEKRQLAADDLVIGSLVDWAKSGEAMAHLALEAEFHRSLLRFVSQWHSDPDTSPVVDRYGPTTSRWAATTDWLLGEFAVTVLTCNLERSYRSGIHGSMRSRFSHRANSARARMLNHVDFIGATSELDLVCQGRDVEPAETSGSLRRICEASAVNESSAARVEELAERVWLRDEPIQAAASAAGLSYPAARQRLVRLAEFGRTHPELLAS